METHIQAVNRQPATSARVIADCEICGGEYDLGVEVVAYGRTQRFHSFACAIQALAPRCAHCQRRIVGHGPAGPGSTFCCDRCAIPSLPASPASSAVMAYQPAY